jgi:LysM repeat protein
MPKHARNRSLAKRLTSARGAVVVATFAALSCAALTGTASAAAPETAKTTAPAVTTPTAGHHTYKVKKGDTLIGIARHHKVRGGWKGIASLNHITSPYIIHPGQVLKLPAAPSTATAAPAASVTAYPDNLDGWIKHSLAVMAEKKIPGTYDGIHRNIMRESSGNPNAINLWDSNAAAGTPSKGLLQVIQPTFDAYHVPGTSMNIYDPVANITAACNYAYHVYGSIDNVNGPY